MKILLAALALLAVIAVGVTCSVLIAAEPALACPGKC